eukprot:g11704.t1
MLKPKRLSALRMLYFEPLEVVGAAMADRLHAEGFEGVHRVHHLSAVLQRLTQEDPHLLMLEMDQHDEDLIQIVRRLRRGRVGPDPFVGVLACKSAVTSDDARRFAAAGFDHILNKPHSADAVLSHVLEIAGKPRRFVAVKGYVGPDRRRGLRDANQPGVMEAPNRLAIALEGAAFDRERYAARVSSWKAMLARVDVV